MNQHSQDPDDLIVWPDGEYCSRFELGEYRHKSDDYEVLPYGSQQWGSFVQAAEAMEPEEFREFIKSP